MIENNIDVVMNFFKREQGNWYTFHEVFEILTTDYPDNFGTFDDQKKARLRHIISELALQNLLEKKKIGDVDATGGKAVFSYSLKEPVEETVE